MGAADLIAVLIGYFLFPQVKNKWVEQVKVVADCEAASEEFGRAIAIKGNTAAISAPCDCVPDSGECKGTVHIYTIIVSGGDRRCASAYVYVRSATGEWLLQAELTPRRRDVGYSNAVAISGNTAIIGTPGENLQQGAAYVFERNPATGEWLQQTKLVPRDLPPFFAYGFGASVAIDGDAIVVGTSTKTLTNIFAFTWNRGGAYAYVRAPVKGGWSQPTKLLPQADEQVTQTYGEVVSICGDRVMVSAGEPNNAAYIFRRSQ